MWCAVRKKSLYRTVLVEVALSIIETYVLHCGTRQGHFPMKIEVRLVAALDRGRGGTMIREVPQATAGRALAEKLGIPTEEVGIVLVNGRHASLDEALADGDVLSLLPMIGGG